MFPWEELETLNPLVKFLRGLPLPATHPSHPAAAVILSALKEAQRGYAEMRGTWASEATASRAQQIAYPSTPPNGPYSGRANTVFIHSPFFC